MISNALSCPLATGASVRQLMQEPTTLSNRYFVCLPGQPKTVPLDPFAYRQDAYPKFIEIDYLAKAFQVLEKSGPKNLTFYITWNVHELPTYGDDVVVVLMGDEWCRFPRYLGRVRAVFRSHANWPMYTGNLANGVTYSNVISAVQFLRLQLIGLPGRLAYLVHRYFQGHDYPTKTYVIPLGYANQLDLPIIPLKDRSTDVSFMGSVNNELSGKLSLKYWLRSPKTVAREQMLQNARTLQQNPDLNVYLQGTEQFTGNLLDSGQPLEDEKNRYSSKLMDTKICLVPRGSSLETFRLFEAVRYGCIVICGQLPQRWYYDSLPAAQIDNWSNLEKTVDDLLGNPERLEQLHQKALTYWQTSCSETVLGRYMAAQLTQADSRLYSDKENSISSQLASYPKRP